MRQAAKPLRLCNFLSVLNMSLCAAMSSSRHLPTLLQVLCPQVVQVWLSEVAPLLRLRYVAQHNLAFNDLGQPLLRSLFALTGKHMHAAVHGVADDTSLHMLPPTQQSLELTGGTDRSRVLVPTHQTR